MKEKQFGAADTLVIFGEQFSAGYVNGLVEQQGPGGCGLFIPLWDVAQKTIICGH